MGEWTKGGRGAALEGMGGASLCYPKAICRLGEWGSEGVGCGEGLDCTDPSEARFSLQVKFDMEKIMEKLGGVFK